MQERKPLYLPCVADLAERIGRPVAVLDLETNGLGGARFAITEIAVWKVDVNGRQSAFQTLVNPQEYYPIETQRFTGITEAEVLKEASFAKWANVMKKVLEECLCVGFNSRSFDLPGLCSQIERYGVDLPKPGQALDLRDAWRGIHLPPRGRGKLGFVAEHYGCGFEGAHRALADTIGTTQILEAMLAQHGMGEIVGFVAPTHVEGRPAPAPDVLRARQKEKTAQAARERAELAKIQRASAKAAKKKLAEAFAQPTQATKTRKRAPP